MEIFGIVGSLRRESFNRRLLDAAARELAGSATVRMWDDLAEIPPFNEDAEDRVPPPVERFRAAIAHADAVLIATPEYNGSIPGQLKNALDWASRPRDTSALNGAPVATMSASPTPHGAIWSQQALRTVLGIAGAHVVGGELAVPEAFRQFDEAGRLTDAELATRLSLLCAELRSSATKTVAA